MKCPVCKRAKCKWIDLKDDPKKLSSKELIRVVDHNVSVIEMTFRNNDGSSHAEERMYNRLNAYTDEIGRRGKTGLDVK